MKAHYLDRRHMVVGIVAIWLFSVLIHSPVLLLYQKTSHRVRQANGSIASVSNCIAVTPNPSWTTGYYVMEALQVALALQHCSTVPIFILQTSSAIPYPRRDSSGALHPDVRGAVASG